MIEKIIGGISGFIIATISALGYSGVALLMAIESACIPLPSEVIMPFSGYLVAAGRFNLQLGRDRRRDRVPTGVIHRILRRRARRTPIYRALRPLRLDRAA